MIIKISFLAVASIAAYAVSHKNSNSTRKQLDSAAIKPPGTSFFVICCSKRKKAALFLLFSYCFGLVSVLKEVTLSNLFSVSQFSCMLIHVVIDGAFLYFRE